MSELNVRSGLNIRRNTILLAAILGVNSCLFQLAAALNALTFVGVTGIEGLLGLGPAIFLAASGLAALPAGRAMDRFGRTPVIVMGFVAAALGCVLIAISAETGSTAAITTSVGQGGMGTEALNEPSDSTSTRRPAIVTCDRGRTVPVSATLAEPNGVVACTLTRGGSLRTCTSQLAM